MVWRANKKEKEKVERGMLGPGGGRSGGTPVVYLDFGSIQKALKAGQMSDTKMGRGGGESLPWGGNEQLWRSTGKTDTRRRGTER